jgi:hypothetical protein
MQQRLTRLLSQIERLEARRAANANALPVWAARGSQGFLMVVTYLKELLSRISQAADPEWFEPDPPTDEAWHVVKPLGLAMLASDGYQDAWQLAQTELAKWPRYRYRRSDVPQKEQQP